MKIAILAPLVRPVHPDTRGSRPRIVYDLAKYLIKKGHEVTTYASGDSQIEGKIVKVSPQATYFMPPAENPFYQQTIYIAKMINILMRHSKEFDIIHNHAYPEFLPVLMTPFLKSPMVTTIHLPITEPIAEFLKNYQKTYFVAVSNNQRKDIEGINFLATVYNGIDVKKFPFKKEEGEYLLFFGRMGGDDPKGLAFAIEIARKLGEKLKIAGNVQSERYFDEKIKPNLDEKIKFIGPIDPIGPISFKEKANLYRNAKALLFPISINETFGMVMIEAMACGTPVIAFDKGAVREIIEDGKTGFTCPFGDIECMTKAVKQISQIDRSICRKIVEEKFTAERMTDDYERIYRKILGI